MNSKQDCDRKPNDETREANASDSRELAGEELELVQGGMNLAPMALGFGAGKAARSKLS